MKRLHLALGALVVFAAACVPDPPPAAPTTTTPPPAVSAPSTPVMVGHEVGAPCPPGWGATSARLVTFRWVVGSDGGSPITFTNVSTALPETSQWPSLVVHEGLITAVTLCVDAGADFAVAVQVRNVVGVSEYSEWHVMRVSATGG